jgi:hypothetical protein
MIPCVDNSVLDNFTANAVPLKPEAPWIKKCSFGIKFTDEIYMTDDDDENTPDEDNEYKKRKERQNRSLDGEVELRSHSEPVLCKNIFDESRDDLNADDPHELIKLFKEQYPEAEIDIEPEELDESQLQ